LLGGQTIKIDHAIIKNKTNTMSQVQQRERRLGKELLKLKQKPLDNTSVDLVDDNNAHWKIQFKGPASTPFEKGTFTFDFKFPNEYPFHPPEVKCSHQVWHPNFGMLLNSLSTNQLINFIILIR
jgi:ubiquitin-protein ligase